MNDTSSIWENCTPASGQKYFQGLVVRVYDHINTSIYLEQCTFAFKKLDGCCKVYFHLPAGPALPLLESQAVEPGPLS